MCMLQMDLPLMWTAEFFETTVTAQAQRLDPLSQP